MSRYENYIIQILKKSKIKFVREKTFKDLHGGKYRFDFFINDYHGQKIIIEMDGEQHFKPIYGRQNFLAGQERDRCKNSYCLANNLKLYRIPYWELKEIKTIEDIVCEKHLVHTKWHNDNLIPPQ